MDLDTTAAKLESKSARNSLEKIGIRNWKEMNFRENA